MLCYSALQGESDAGITSEAPGYRVYRQLLTALLASWRERLQQPALPFVIVQVVPSDELLHLPGPTVTLRRMHVTRWAAVACAPAT